MKIRFYSGFDTKLRQLITEITNERGHIIGGPLEPALITFMEGWRRSRLPDHVRAAHAGSGFVVVVNPAHSADHEFLDAGAWDILHLDSNLFDHELKVEIDAYIAELEQAMARIT